MLSFKQYITEASKIDFAPWQDPNNPAYIPPTDDFIDRNKLRLKKDGTYTNNKAYNLFIPIKLDNGEVVLPVKFSVLKYFDTIGSTTSSLTSMWGAPDVVSASMTIDSDTIKTLDHLNVDAFHMILDCPALETFGDAQIRCESMVLGNVGSVKFSELKNHISIEKKLTITAKAIYKKPALGLIQIPGDWIFERFLALSGFTPEQNNECKQVIDILRKYKDDMLECKEQLINAGLKEYAKF